MSANESVIAPGQSWEMNEARADPDDVPPAHDVELWPARPSFHAVVDDVLDGVAELTVATSNDHPRTPAFATTIDVAVETLREDPRWEARR